MYLLKHVTIDGLWGSRTVSFALDDEVNFLIGRNGSGKTAVMRLVANVLAGKSDQLRHENFKSIDLFLEDEEGSFEILQASLELAEADGTPSVNWSIGMEPQSPPKRLGLRREHTPTTVRTLVQNELRVTWLSIDRDVPEKANLAGLLAPQQQTQSRLSEVRSSLTRYFAGTKSLVDIEMEEFIKFVFKNLIPDTSSKVGLSLDDNNSEGSLLQIFENFGIYDESSRARAHDFFARVKKISALAKAEQYGDVGAEDFLAISSAVRISLILEKWHALTEKRQEILLGQERFLRKLNLFLSQKTIVIGRTNEPECILVDGRTIPLNELSSGERQIFMILGEALLQEQERSIYMADEPELSLHIQWQEQLVDAIREINPSAQILFATHSPDVIAALLNMCSTWSRLLMTLERSEGGLANEYLFHQVDAVIWLEGGTGDPNQLAREPMFSSGERYYALQDPRSLFTLNQAGSKTQLIPKAKQIRDLGLRRVAVCMDRDHDNHDGSLIKDSNVFYTHLYSWENEVWTAKNLIAYFEDVYGGIRPAVVDTVLESQKREFRKKLRWEVVADVLRSVHNLPRYLSKRTKACG